MIKINLTPFEELENPLWWVPDLLLLVTVALVGVFGTQLYLGDSKDRIVQFTKDAEKLEAGTKSLAPDVKKHDELENDNKTLESKLNSLGKLTASEVIRYKPIIILEHLQNLSPVGVWFDSITFKKEEEAQGKEPTNKKPPPNPKDKNAATTAATTEMKFESEMITISGRGFDNLLVAEFLSALRATQTQEVDPKDLRTHVYFSKIVLIESKLAAGLGPVAMPETSVFGSSAAPGEANGGWPQFQINLEVREHKIDKATDALTVSQLWLPSWLRSL